MYVDDPQASCILVASKHREKSALPPRVFVLLFLIYDISRLFSSHQHRESFLIRAAIIGMGSWGQNLVNSVQGRSDVIRFVAGATRTPSKVTDFAAKHDIRLVESYDCILGDA